MHNVTAPLLATVPSSQAAMLEEGVLERAARGVWGASSKPDRYSK